jgi:hypothetical protein
MWQRLRPPNVLGRGFETCHGATALGVLGGNPDAAATLVSRYSLVNAAGALCAVSSLAAGAALLAPTAPVSVSTAEDAAGYPDPGNVSAPRTPRGAGLEDGAQRADDPRRNEPSETAAEAKISEPSLSIRMGAATVGFAPPVALRSRVSAGAANLLLGGAGTDGAAATDGTDVRIRTPTLTGASARGGTSGNAGATSAERGGSASAGNSSSSVSALGSVGSSGGSGAASKPAYAWAPTDGRGSGGGRLRSSAWSHARGAAGSALSSLTGPITYSDAANTTASPPARLNGAARHGSSGPSGRQRFGQSGSDARVGSARASGSGSRGSGSSSHARSSGGVGRGGEEG